MLAWGGGAYGVIMHPPQTLLLLRIHNTSQPEADC